MQREDPPFRDLRDYVARRGQGKGPTTRRPGWLIRDLNMLLTEYDRLLGVKPEKPKMSWAQVWSLFDRRKK